MKNRHFKKCDPGFTTWGKLIHILRASFETDLLNGEYGKFGLHTIANWLGHSVKVMLEHYGRIQQSDFDQIAEACVKIKEGKNQTMGQKETHLVPFPLRNEGLTPPNKASLNASLYTAVEGEFEGNGAENPSCPNLQHALENKAHDGSKRQVAVSCVNYHNVPIEGPSWRRRESNPRPDTDPNKRLRVYPIL